jgi:hypothetical protein
MLSTIPGATADAVLYAEEQGWIELEGAHSACLTEEGRRLIAKEANQAQPDWPRQWRPRLLRH